MQSRIIILLLLMVAVTSCRTSSRMEKKTTIDLTEERQHRQSDSEDILVTETESVKEQNKIMENMMFAEDWDAVIYDTSATDSSGAHPVLAKVTGKRTSAKKREVEQTKETAREDSTHAGSISSMEEKTDTEKKEKTDTEVKTSTRPASWPMAAVAIAVIVLMATAKKKSL